MENKEEDNYLGEGTFGVVYLLTYEGREAVMKEPYHPFIDPCIYAHEAKVLEHLAGAGGAPRLLLLDEPEDVRIVMTFSGRKTLKQLVMDEVLTAGSLLRTSLSVARQLQEVHGKGVIHNDIKADNVIVNPVQGSEHYEAKLIDFGMAKFMDGVRPADEEKYNRYGEEVLWGEGDAAGDALRLAKMVVEALDEVCRQRGLGRLPDHLTRQFKAVSSVEEVIYALQEACQEYPSADPLATSAALP